MDDQERPGSLVIPLGPPSWRLKSGILVGTDANGLVFMDAKGAVLRRTKAIGGDPFKLSNGNIVVGSEGQVRSRLLELKDGTILASIGQSEGASHNLLIFTPTGRSFVPPAPVSGKRCRVVHSFKFRDFLSGRRNCPKDPDSLPAVRNNYSWIESLCVTQFPGSRTTHLKILGCRIIPPTKGKLEPFTMVVPRLQTEVTMAYGACEPLMLNQPVGCEVLTSIVCPAASRAAVQDSPESARTVTLVQSLLVSLATL